MAMPVLHTPQLRSLAGPVFWAMHRFQFWGMVVHACWENNKSKHQPGTPQSYKTWPVKNRVRACFPSHCILTITPATHSPLCPGSCHCTLRILAYCVFRLD